MRSLDRRISEILAVEGWPEYTDDVSDSGGPTKGGITLKTLAGWRNAHVTDEDVMNLTEVEARQIYEDHYWYAPGFDRVAHVDEEVADELLDTGVNMGPRVAIRFLQRVLTAFNDRGRHYRDLSVDGVIGPMTLDALRSYLLHRGEDGARVLLFTLDALQVERYLAIAERREKDERFVYGQILQRAVADWKRGGHKKPNV